MKRIIPALLLAGLLAGPSTAALAGDGPKHGAMHGERAEKMAAWLELSDTQRAELQQLRVNKVSGQGGPTKLSKM